MLGLAMPGPRDLEVTLEHSAGPKRPSRRTFWLACDEGDTHRISCVWVCVRVSEDDRTGVGGCGELSGDVDGVTSYTLRMGRVHMDGHMLAVRYAMTTTLPEQS